MTAFRDVPLAMTSYGTCMKLWSFEVCLKRVDTAGRV